jgi:release factor glutamine methyltransferase
MVSVRILWEETVEKLEKIYPRKEAEQIVYLLLEESFRIPKNAILLYEQLPVNTELFDSHVERLLLAEPIQYVINKAHFFGHDFYVDRSVLIPRPETEELVDLIVKRHQHEKISLLDIGTGSGCIAISLALALNGDFFAMDYSDEALHVAKQNAKNLKANVHFLNNDVLNEPFPVSDLDLIVSNPPYIPESDRNLMHRNVLDYEPDMALFVQNDDPLCFYRSIAEQGKLSLKKPGWLYFEIHELYGDAIVQLLNGLGYSCNIHQDLQGKDRMVSAQL